ncbi:type II toxin-antitoxin system HicA family toxin [candidate division KSB1 bacterium]|nr:type II toxin-antitoxin system HicA family toxin [candidate division KSB1 bacterium]NIR71032.1 type II toxin-antitoxin system HicA family toxin [candidate division KSB1 bacterium]NIS26117.1 type II toxin-antitoxin system HicA family toxin [candidate division KSB1 bacterium]NIT72911.1 type II toxin-antitoxin system HicA family toxin [candidate division KSB1 bacterium]NIU26756.1 type II toxin-antitoxin system HicA family toxin [candidate division KSB1 bacterium]
MKAYFRKGFAKLLEKKGWELRRMKGSHHIYAKEGTPVRISVPIHGKSPLKIGLLKHFMKVAEIDESEL